MRSQLKCSEINGKLLCPEQRTTGSCEVLEQRRRLELKGKDLMMTAAVNKFGRPKTKSQKSQKDDDEAHYSERAVMQIIM